MQPFEFVQPLNVAAVLAAIDGADETQVMLWGGGTATVLLMKQGLITPAKLVGLQQVAELGGIGRTGVGGVRIGAATCLRELEQSPLLWDVLPCLAKTVGNIGNVRVRNAATVGGHLVHADPAQDLPPLLLALDATVTLVRRGGERIMPLAEFFVDTLLTDIQPGELLTAVQIPPAALARRTRYVKYAPRSLDDYGTVGVAGSLDLAVDARTCREVRIAVGGAGPVVRRFPDAEAVLAGQTLTPARCRAAAAVVAEQVEPWDDSRGSTAYKRAMSRVWTERVLTSLAGARWEGPV